MKPTILLTGKSGQVGTELRKSLSSIGRVVAPSRQDLDLIDSENIRTTVRSIRPQIIVNAAAYTSVDAAESDTGTAQSVNAIAPAILAEEAKKVGAFVVHYSTDYVFNGLKHSPYEETDTPAPINIYGKTKLAGEQAVRDSGVPHLIFRTAWIYSTRGSNFLLRILRLATEREELRIVKDQTGSPTWSREVAVSTTRILAQMVKQDFASSTSSEHGGTYHMTAGGEASWFEFARAILKEAVECSPDSCWFAKATGKKPVIVRRIVPISTAEYPTPASRPAYSVLSNCRLLQEFGRALPDWRTQLHLAFTSGSVAQRVGDSS